LHLVGFFMWIILWCTDPRTSSSSSFSMGKVQDCQVQWPYRPWDILYMKTLSVTHQRTTQSTDTLSLKRFWNGTTESVSGIPIGWNPGPWGPATVEPWGPKKCSLSLINKRHTQLIHCRGTGQVLKWHDIFFLNVQTAAYTPPPRAKVHYEFCHSALHHPVLYDMFYITNCHDLYLHFIAYPLLLLLLCSAKIFLFYVPFTFCYI